MPSLILIRLYCSNSLGPANGSSAMPQRITSMSRFFSVSSPHSRCTGQAEHFACAIIRRTFGSSGSVSEVQFSTPSPRHFALSLQSSSTCVASQLIPHIASNMRASSASTAMLATTRRARSICSGVGGTGIVWISFSNELLLGCCTIRLPIEDIEDRDVQLRRALGCHVDVTVLEPDRILVVEFVAGLLAGHQLEYAQPDTGRDLLDRNTHLHGAVRFTFGLRHSLPPSSVLPRPVPWSAPVGRSTR